MTVATTDLLEPYLKRPKHLLEMAECIKEEIWELPLDVRKVLRYIAKDSLDPYAEPSLVYTFVDKLDKYLSSHKLETFVRAVRWEYVHLYDNKLFGNPLELKNFLEKVADMMKGKGVNSLHYLEFIDELKKENVLFETPTIKGVPIKIGLTPEACEAKRILDIIRGPSVSMFPIMNLDGKLPKEAENSKVFLEYKELYINLVAQAINGERIRIPNK